MTHHEHTHNTVESHAEASHALARSYFIGFSASLVLTILSFQIVISLALSTTYLAFFIVTSALMQIFVQLHFFLHLGTTTGARWQKTALALAILFASILVGGTLWIMNNLQHNTLHKMFNDGVIDTHHEQD